jgi:hypothetical protein
VESGQCDPVKFSLGGDHGTTGILKSVFPRLPRSCATPAARTVRPGRPSPTDLPMTRCPTSITMYGRPTRGWEAKATCLPGVECNICVAEVPSQGRDSLELLSSHTLSRISFMLSLLPGDVLFTLEVIAQLCWIDLHNLRTMAAKRGQRPDR